MDNVAFRGAEIKTPVGSIAIGRGHSYIAGDEAFTGLAIDLPFGRFRVGWRLWTEKGQLVEPEPEPLSEQFKALVKHLLMAAVILAGIWLAGVRGDGLRWAVGIWGFILVLQTLRIGMSVVDRLWSTVPAWISVLISRGKTPT